MSSSGFRDQHFYGSYLGLNTQKKVRSATARADFSCLGSRHSSWLKLKHIIIFVLRQNVNHNRKQSMIIRKKEKVKKIFFFFLNIDLLD